MFRQIRFNLWVLWHDIRSHKIFADEETLEYPIVRKTVFCMTCNHGKIITYRDGLENYH